VQICTSKSSGGSIGDERNNRIDARMLRCASSSRRHSAH
jgi:hypothetical protein